MARDIHGQNIWDGKSSISLFQAFFASIDKVYILEVRLCTRL